MILHHTNEFNISLQTKLSYYPMNEQLTTGLEPVDGVPSICNFQPAFAMLNTPKQCEICSTLIQENEWACFDATSNSTARFHRDCFRCGTCSSELYATWAHFFRTKKLKPVHQYQTNNKSLYFCSEDCINAGKPLPCHRCKQDIVLPRRLYKSTGGLSFHPECYTCRYGCVIQEFEESYIIPRTVIEKDGTPDIYCPFHFVDPCANLRGSRGSTGGRI